jgi:hypothetical protein
MKTINILNFITEEKIKNTINQLGQHKLKPTSHLYPQLGAVTILEAAQLHSMDYTDYSKQRPAVSLIEVVLSANRSYVRHVLPNIIRIKNNSDIASFKDLTNLIDLIGIDAFYKFWGHRHAQKFSVLINVLNAADHLKYKYKIEDDYEVMNKWANEVDVSNYTSDIIGSIKYIAIATLQHLRMTYGCNTVKPDLRVKQVLLNEFQLGTLSDVKTIQSVEQMSDITGYSALMLDQIFVNYGSGYYNLIETPIINPTIVKSCNANKS